MQVIKIQKRVLGEGHPDTLTSIFSLAYVLKSQSRGKEAISLMTTCWKLRNHLLGSTHPHTEYALKALKKWKDEEDGQWEDSD